MRKFLLIPLIALSLIGCANTGSSSSVELSLPINRFHSPETVGSGQYYIDITGLITETVDATYAPGPGLAPYSTPRLNKDKVDPEQTRLFSIGKLFENFGMNLDGRYGVSDSVQFVVTPLPTDLVYTIGVQWQLLGEPSSYANTGNTSLSIGLHGGQRSMVWDNEEDALSAPNPSCLKKYSTEMRSTVVDAEIIGGHRITRSTLIYGGMFFRDYDNKGSYNLNDPCTAVTRGSWQTGTEMSGYNIGLSAAFDQKLILGLETAWADIEAGQSRLSDQFTSLRIGYRW